MEKLNKSCCFCGKEIIGWGNNPSPVNNDEDARCCDDCNWDKVVPVRLMGMFLNPTKVVK